MKKVININFQGRVIPIEESAYDMLKQYIDSLRIFFANEEGKDEIINDIEGRIAELFGETLKKGSICITEGDVNTIINSMGRPEDFEGDEARVHSQLDNDQTHKQGEKSSAEPRGRLYRSENDKLLGGVCAGVANYLRIDPTIVRILFAVITFGGFGFGVVLYIILWILLPAKRLQTNLKKRLFRNPDDRIIGGVAGGLSAYFNIQVWVPRVIFALPLIVGIVSSVFSNVFFDFDPFPAVFFGSFGTSLTVIYVILWIVIPEANSASERLEMRGEKVDLNSIKNTFKEEVEGFKKEAVRLGTDVKEKATAWGNEFKNTVEEKSQAFSTEAAPIMRKTSSRIGNAIGIMFKAFFLFIAGVIVFALLMALLGLMIGGVSVFPLKDFFLEGFWQNFLAWATLLLFLGTPVIGLIIWIVRRIIGVKSKNNYLGFIFGGLWTIGLISGIFLAALLSHAFNSMAEEKQDYTIQQPTNDKMIVKVAESKVRVYGRWFKMEGLISMTDDSLYLNNVRLKIMKSPDSNYHSYAIKSSHAGSDAAAVNNIKAINYEINQADSMMYLSRGFALTKGTKFRNQSVSVTIQVPVGKKIMVDNSVTRKFNWWHFNNRNNNDWNNDDWEETERWNTNVEYIMTASGLERVKKEDINENEGAGEDEVTPDTDLENFKKSREEMELKRQQKLKELEELDRELQKPADTTRYRYTPKTPAEKKSANVKTAWTEQDNNAATFKNMLFVKFPL